MNDKIRAVIIDDEETAIDNLCFELKKYPWISVEGIAYNGKAGIRLLEKERPDLLFLDVAYIIHSGFISGYQNRYGDNLKPPTNVYHRMTA